MEFEIDRTEFLEGLRLTQGVVERRNTLPILSNALIEAMIESTLFAVSLDETRISLSGVYVENHDGALRMVATDGHRLALIDRKLDGSVPDKGAILPRKGLMEAKKLLEGGDGGDDD